MNKVRESVKSLAAESREAAKAVVRLHVQGFSESNVQSTLDPRFVVKETWIGSGFFIKIGDEDGYILTNSHVARNADRIEIRSIMTSDEPFQVEVLGLVEDLEPDIALLRLREGERQRFIDMSYDRRIPFLEFADSTKIQRGDEIKALGYPLGMNEPNISGGEISNFVSGTHETAERIVTDAAINPGNSGGPSVGSGGRVVGINTAIAFGAENIGFVTPIHLAANVLRGLLNHHQAGISRLAASLQKNSVPNAKFLGMEAAKGVIITKVYDGGFAKKVGLQNRDVILAVNGVELDRHGNVTGERNIRKRNIFDVFHSIPLGEKIRLKIFRHGRTFDLEETATLWAGIGFPLQPILIHRRYMEVAGMIIQEICNELANALAAAGFDREIVYREFFVNHSQIIVTQIESGTTAEYLGIDPGDFLVRVDGHEVKSLEGLQFALGKAQTQKQESVLLEFSSGAFAYLDIRHIEKNQYLIHHFAEKFEEPRFDSHQDLPAQPMSLGTTSE